MKKGCDVCYLGIGVILSLMGLVWVHPIVFWSGFIGGMIYLFIKAPTREEDVSCEEREERRLNEEFFLEYRMRQEGQRMLGEPNTLAEEQRKKR